jgi:GT2 family glycosyltransferase
MNTNDKIFVGVVTCNRPNFFKQCFEHIKKCSNIDYIGVVNDGKEDINRDILVPSVQYIHNRVNLGVGKSKNILFKQALEKQDVKHIFIIEDDILIKEQEIIDLYIQASKISGIEHFMFGYHGPANRGNISRGQPCPRFIVDYGKLQIAINTHSVGAFCYYTRNVLETVGLIDEEYLNAFEHVDHDYRIAKAGLTTPYWNWPDVANSYEFLDEIECSENSSSIRPRSDWMDNIKKGAHLFYKKHGLMPAWQNCVPDSSKQKVIDFLKQLKTKKCT